MQREGICTVKNCGASKKHELEAVFQVCISVKRMK